MRDQLSLERAATLHPKVRSEVVQLIAKAEAGLPITAKIRIVQALRTFVEQNELYAIGRTKPGKIVTKVGGGYSYHNYGLAVDFAFMYDRDNNGTFETLSWNTKEDFDNDGTADWQEVVRVFKAAGWAWGGDWHSFKDYPHFEKSFNYSTNELLRIYVKQNCRDGLYVMF